MAGALQPKNSELASDYAKGYTEGYTEGYKTAYADMEEIRRAGLSKPNFETEVSLGQIVENGGGQASKN